MCTFYIDITGQILGFSGAILLYFFGLPSQVRPDGASFLRLNQDDEAEKLKYKHHQKISRAALFLIILSFLLQFLSTIIKS
jgi:hypothetical protein